MLAPAQPGCCSVAPLWPQQMHRARPAGSAEQEAGAEAGRAWLPLPRKQRRPPKGGRRRRGVGQSLVMRQCDGPASPDPDTPLDRRCGSHVSQKLARPAPPSEGFAIQLPDIACRGGSRQLSQNTYGVARPCWTSMATTMGAPPSRDHRIPKSRGGSNNLANIEIIARRCNEEKGRARNFSAAEASPRRRG